MLAPKRLVCGRSTRYLAGRPYVIPWAAVFSLSLLAALLIALMPTGAARGATSIVRPDPLNAEVAIGDTVVVNLYIQDVTNLYGADIRLQFDPMLLEVQDAAPTQPGVQIRPLSDFLRPDFVIKKKACNVVDPGDPDCSEAGIVWYAATQINPSPPVSGSGALAAVTFKALRHGVSPLKVVYRKLSGSSGVEIASETQNGTLTVTGGTPGTLRLYLPLILRGS